MQPTADRALRFYVDKLGFKKKRRRGDSLPSRLGALGANREGVVGYEAIRIVDPDGNELLFPLDETNERP